MKILPLQFHKVLLIFFFKHFPKRSISWHIIPPYLISGPWLTKILVRKVAWIWDLGQFQFSSQWSQNWRQPLNVLSHLWIFFFLLCQLDMPFSLRAQCWCELLKIKLVDWSNGKTDFKLQRLVNPKLKMKVILGQRAKDLIGSWNRTLLVSRYPTEQKTIFIPF
jgi:hypothetical protein